MPVNFMGRSASHIREVVWATPAAHMSLDDLIERMKVLGNEVLEVDRVNNRLKLADGITPLTEDDAPGDDPEVRAAMDLALEDHMRQMREQEMHR